MAIPQQNVGLFVPTTNIWDVLEKIEDPGTRELLLRLYYNINLIAETLNKKDSGYYTTIQEFINGQLFFPNPANTAFEQSFRQVYRNVVNFGALPNATSKSVPHNATITSSTTFTRIYAAASDTTGNNYIPIPYASNTAGANIQLDVNATDVVITTGSNRTNFTVCYVIIEYIQT